MIVKRLAVAPMMNWTDSHCRIFYRGLSKKAVLYTEMISSNALKYGDYKKYLEYNPLEHPISLQLGGNNPKDLAWCVQLAKKYDYDEVDLNCGCPSKKVQNGAFGICLMMKPDLGVDCVKAMVDASNIPITVKHRLGWNNMNPDEQIQDYQKILDFMCRIAEAGANQLTIHARNAILDKNFSAKQNRKIPPLYYEVAKRLRIDIKKHFPNIKILLNGGLNSNQDIMKYLEYFDGCMIGRAVYHDPCLLLDWDNMLLNNFPSNENNNDLNFAKWKCIFHYLTEQTVELYRINLKRNKLFDITSLTRHMLGLLRGKNSRHWRKQLSDRIILSSIKDEQHIRLFFERLMKYFI